MHSNWANSLVELDYVETKTPSLSSQKFWRRPNPPGVVGGWKFVVSIGNAIGLQWLVVHCCWINSKQWQGKKGVSEFKFQKFLITTKCEDHSSQAQKNLWIKGQVLCKSQPCRNPYGQEGFYFTPYPSLAAHYFRATTCKDHTCLIPTANRVGQIVHSHHFRHLILRLLAIFHLVEKHIAPLNAAHSSLIAQRD